jgi:hypothetical protein
VRAAGMDTIASKANGLINRYTISGFGSGLVWSVWSFKGVRTNQSRRPRKHYLWEVP